MRLISKVVASVITLLLFFARSASADEFDMPAGSCFPVSSELSVLDNTSVPGAAKSSSATMVLTLYCPMPELTTSPTTLFMLYGRTSGTVQATYAKISKSDGVKYNLVTVQGDTTGDPKFKEASISDTYDPAHYVYFLIVEVGPSNTFYAGAVY